MDVLALRAQLFNEGDDDKAVEHRDAGQRYEADPSAYGQRNTAQQQRCDLAAQLGCEYTERGAIRTGDYETTNVPALFVAGDASRAVQLAIVAAAEGAEAAFAINKLLIKEDLAAQKTLATDLRG